MTKGTLGMIVCPMLEDEAIYNLETDSEEKKVLLVNTSFNGTIIPKMVQHGIKFEMADRDNLGKDQQTEGYRVIIWTMFLALHEDIEFLKKEVMRQMKESQQYVDTILLYYGRCGRALDNICEWAAENIDVPVCIFRNNDGTICDDCVCVPLGGSENYLKLMKKYPGVLYFTPAMASNFDGFIAMMEMFVGLESGGPDSMKLILDMDGYTKMLRIQTGIGDQVNFDANVERFSKKLDLDVETLEDGWTSNDIADMNYSKAKDTMTRWLADRPMEGA